MAAYPRTRHLAFMEKLGRKVAVAAAVIRYGHPFALDPVWREAQVREEAARQAHGTVRPYQAEKARRIYQALLAGRGH